MILGRGTCWILAGLIVPGSCDAALIASPRHPDAQAIVARSVEVGNADWNAAPSYDFTEQDRLRDGTATYRVMMILGTPYYYPVAKGGKPLTPEEAQDARGGLANAIAQRRAETTRERADRIAKYERDRKRDHLLMSQLSVAFDFKFVREESMGPYRVWELKATPRAGYRPPNLETRALTGMTGTLWVDIQTYQWVKVEAHVIRPVAIEGFLAEVEPGTNFELDKAPVAKGIWLPRHFVMHAHAKVLFLLHHRSQVDETYTQYRPSNGLYKAS